MGEVYRARDLNLHREVAIKLLQSLHVSNPDRLSRFEREARLLASLSHPNIATIHGLDRANGTTFLIMELAPGETLAGRLARGRVAILDALPIGLQIAAALEAAHEKGVVHRDLKPANIAITADGKVKVLDFGLAKLMSDDSTEPGTTTDLSQSPTIARDRTAAGMILGTAAYMSPEQARGKPIDQRTDIWAFGCVLYELLAGKPAFAGETLTDIVAAVVNSDPDWQALPEQTPQAIRSLLRRTLKKDPAKRLRDVADARIEIEEAMAEPAVDRAKVVSARPPSSSVARILPWIVAAVAIAALLATSLLPRETDPSRRPVARLELNVPPGVELGTTYSPNISFSPDGTALVYTGTLGGLRRMYVRRLDAFESSVIKGTETLNLHTVSPTSLSVAFIMASRVLRTVSLADGLVSDVIRDVDYSAGLDWGEDDWITFGRNGELWQVPAKGGAARQLTTLDAAAKEVLHGWPAVVAGGSTILFTTVSAGERTVSHIDSISVTTKQRRRVIEGGRNPLYTPSGHLVFFRDGAVIAAPYDATTLESTGPAVAVLQDVALDLTGSPLMSFSGTGSLAYISNRYATKQLVWVSRQGVEQPISDTPRPYQNPRLSPDGLRLVVEVAGGDLWTLDTARPTFARLTSGATLGNTFAVLAPDGRRVAFRSLSGTQLLDLDSGGPASAIPGTSVSDIPTSISPDGTTLAFIRQSTESNGDIYTLSLVGDPNPRPLVVTNGYDGGGLFSPDGRWLAYVTNESGQFEVYLRPNPGPDRRVTVSTQGGTHPRWNRNGRELFYRNGNRMMVVDVATSPALTLSQPRVLFEQRYSFGSAQTVPNYDVSADGQRFVMVKDDSSFGRLSIVLNWFDELRRLAPAK